MEFYVEKRHIVGFIIALLILVADLLRGRGTVFFIPLIVIAITVAWSQYWIDYFTRRSQEKEFEAVGGRDTIKVDVGGYLDKHAGNPVPIEGTVEYLDAYGRHAKIAVLRFGDNNRVILTPTLNQVTTRDIFDDLGIDIENTDIVSLKSRVHCRRGFHETGLAGAIFEVDAPGWGPADLTVLPYENIPKDLYPVYTRE